MADDHHRTPVKAPEATDDGMVVGEGPIPVQLLKVIENALDVVHQVGALGVSRKLKDLPGCKFGEDGLRKVLALALEPLDLLLDIDLVVITDVS